MRPDLSSASATIASAHAWLCGELLAGVASGPRQGVPLAVAAGVNADVFLDADYRAMWLAMATAADHGMDRTAAACLCRRALEHTGHWHPEGPISRTGSTWNAESLAMMFYAFPSPATVPALAAELVNLSRRWQRTWRLALAFEQSIAHTLAAVHPRHVPGETESAEVRAA